MDVVALRIQTRVFSNVSLPVNQRAWDIRGAAEYVQTMAEFGGRIARGHLESNAVLLRSLLVAGGVNYGSSCMAESN
jgi:hypothetical protein